MNQNTKENSKLKFLSVLTVLILMSVGYSADSKKWPYPDRIAEMLTAPSTSRQQAQALADFKQYASHDVYMLAAYRYLLENNSNLSVTPAKMTAEDLLEVKKLRLIFSHNSAEPELIYLLLRVMPNIETLEILGNRGRTITSNDEWYHYSNRLVRSLYCYLSVNTKIKHISLACWDLEEEQINMLMSVCGGLDSLDLSWNEFTDSSAEILAYNVHNLRSLAITGTRITDTGLKYIIMSNPNIEHLKLDFIDINVDVDKLGWLLKNLKRLDINSDKDGNKLMRTIVYSYTR